MRFQRASVDRSAALRSGGLSFEKAISMRFKSGEYLGRNMRVASRASMACRILALRWEPRLSTTAISPSFRVGQSTCST